MVEDAIVEWLDLPEGINASDESNVRLLLSDARAPSTIEAEQAILSLDLSN